MNPYLDEHHDVVLGAIQHGRDLLFRPGTSWETTAWVRSEADAEVLHRSLQRSVFEVVAGMGTPALACVGIVHVRDAAGDDPSQLDSRWGVRVTLRSGGDASSGGR